MLFPAAAFAQDAATQERGAGLGEIVVTAQRRSENIQDVPLSVTAADANTLAEARVINAENINVISPSIRLLSTGSPQSSSTNIQIRGIGTTGASRSFEGAVGVFIDGVYRTRSAQALQNFLDVESVQILRGPQGTLFGKNTSAGALLVTSVRPATEAISGNFEATYGNYDMYLVRGAVNVPISDQAAFRIAAMQTDRDGYLKDVNGGSHNWMKDRSVKAQLLLEPSDGLTLTLIGDYARSTGDCCNGTVDAIDGPTQPLIDALSLANGLLPPTSDDWRDYQSTIPYSPMKVEDYGGTLIVDIDVGPGTLRSVTGVRRYSMTADQDVDFSGAETMILPETFDSKFFSQDLTYTGKIEGPFNANYVVGAFFSDETIDLTRDLIWQSQAQIFWDTLFGESGVPAGTANAAPGRSSFEIMGGTAKSFALFTHWDVELNDKFNVIAGVRYSRERKTGYFSEDSYFRDPLFDPLALAGVMPGVPYHEKRTDNAISGTIGIQYRPTYDIMTYLTYNRGFKAGGVNMDVNGAAVPGSVIFGTPGQTGTPLYKPEKVDAFEAGLKMDWLDHRARTNVAIFYNKLSDLQVAQYLGLQFTVLNAPSAKVYGMELEQIFKLNDVITLNAAGTWLPKADFGESALLGAPLSGRRFANAPKLAGNFTVNGEYDLNDAFALTGRIQVQYTSAVFTNTASNARQGGYALLNANIGLKSLSSGVQIEGWVQNLTDKRYLTGHFQTPFQAGDENSYVGAPRTFGVTVRAAF